MWCPDACCQSDGNCNIEKCICGNDFTCPSFSECCTKIVLADLLLAAFKNPYVPTSSIEDLLGGFKISKLLDRGICLQKETTHKVQSAIDGVADKINNLVPFGSIPSPINLKCSPPLKIIVIAAGAGVGGIILIIIIVCIYRKCKRKADINVKSLTPTPIGLPVIQP